MNQKIYLGELYFEKTVEMEMDIWEGRLSTDKDDPVSHFQPNIGQAQCIHTQHIGAFQSELHYLRKCYCSGWCHKFDQENSVKLRRGLALQWHYSG